jgi:hypothetical protein
MIKFRNLNDCSPGDVFITAGGQEAVYQIKSDFRPNYPHWLKVGFTDRAYTDEGIQDLKNPFNDMRLVELKKWLSPPNKLMDRIDALQFEIDLLKLEVRLQQD